MDDTDRRLTALHPRLNATFDGAAWTGVNGWQVLDLAGTQFAHETQLDLSGYSRESMTFFPNALGLQDPGVYLVQGDVDPRFSGLQVMDIITSVPMDLAAVSSLQVQGAGPGMLASDYDFSTILFGMYRFFATNLNIPYTNYVQLERSQRFDSGEETELVYMQRLKRGYELANQV